MQGDAENWEGWAMANLDDVLDRLKKIERLVAAIAKKLGVDEAPQKKTVAKPRRDLKVKF